MPESVISFKSLPPEYQRVIQLAEEQHEIAIAPLQELAGGWSGAIIYLVRVASTDSNKVEHLVLKLDRKRPMSSSDEISRHNAVQDNSPSEFAKTHIPKLAYERVETEDALAIFYAIAGQSLYNFRTLSSYRRQSRIETLFSVTNRILLDEWNAGLSFEQFDHPRNLLKRWLGFRLDSGQKIETFVRETCHLSPEIPGFIVQGYIFPNPLLYARTAEIWGATRPGDAIVGLQHSDLNTNNILANFSRQSDELEGYYLIDFALYKEKMPLLYDQRYLEISYLVHLISKGSYNSIMDLICRYGEHDVLDVNQTVIEMAGINAAIRTGRTAFTNWVQENHPSLHDDLWGQYWLAGTAAGLSYCHKAGQGDEIRLAGLIYAAANLKQYFKLFGLPVPAEASQLYTEGQFIDISKSGVSLLSTLHKPTHNLPASPTNFIGRTAELAELTNLLQKPEIRLVSLTGPGGTGKTRLSLEAGRALLKSFSHGVYFVDLAQISDTSLVSSTIAHTLGIREGGSQPPLEKLKDYLGDKEILLILDNFEQVTAAAPDVAELLAAALGIKVIVTNRILLQLRGEQEYHVPPLDTPADEEQSIEKLIGYESIALFRQQAKSVQPRFEITEDNLPAIVEICRRLDGLPLAIEIAAARIRLLPPQAILKRLDQSLSLLVGGPKDLPDRQQTLRQTIDWSYELLKVDEQVLFARLGVFAGGFTLDAAEEICKQLDIDVFSSIETLLNNSLLRQVKSVSNEPRFDMLLIIREYALKKADEAGIMDELRWAHCSYYTQMAEQNFGEGIYGSDSALWLKRYEEEHDNIRAALSWTLDHPEEGLQMMIAMMPQITWFWFRHGYLREGNEWAERTLAITNGMGDSPPRVFALVMQGMLALWSGNLLVAAQHTQEGVEMSQRIQFDLGLSTANLGYGVTLINQGKDKEAYPYLVDAAELYDQQNQPWMKGTALVHLANVSLGLGNPEQAIKWLDMAMPFLRQTGDVWSMAFGLNNYGEIARALGDYEKAEEYYLRTDELYKLADAKGDQARLVHTLGYIALHKGNHDEARDLFLKSLNDFRELGNHRGIAECLAALAGLAVELENHSWAVPLLSAAERQLTSFGGTWWPADRVEIERAMERMRSALGGEYDALWEQGQAMAVEDAISYATNEAQENK
ncbi:MAG TPA: tetratricopeptide repeat protein [Anaerolineales bacterium]